MRKSFEDSSYKAGQFGWMGLLQVIVLIVLFALQAGSLLNVPVLAEYLAIVLFPQEEYAPVVICFTTEYPSNSQTLRRVGRSLLIAAQLGAATMVPSMRKQRVFPSAPVSRLVL